MSFIQDGIEGEQITPAPSLQSNPISGGGENVGPKDSLDRLPMIIYLNPDDEPRDDLPANPWKTGGNNNEGFAWGDNTLQEFADRLVESKYFDDVHVVQPMHNDMIAGLDKNDQTIVLKVVVPLDVRELNEQAEAPEEFKEEA